MESPNRKILYLEDEESFLDIIKSYCSHYLAAYDIIHASTVSEAIRLFEHRSFDIVLCDYILTGENGVDFLKYVRTVQKSDVPFLIISESDDRDAVISALNNGADYYFEKSSFICGKEEDGCSVLFKKLDRIIELRSEPDDSGIAKKLEKMFRVTIHDVNNSLTVIGMSAELIKERGYDYDGLTENIIISQKSIIDTLDFCIDYWKLGNQKNRWSIVHSTIQKIGKSKFLGNRITNRIPLNLEIFGDCLVEKAFYNILENAFNHGDAKNVYCDIARDNGSIMIIISDDGNGIPAEEKERIFRQGYGKNSGYGLFFCKEVFRSSEMDIREDGVDGARFVITVPESRYRFNDRINT
ncbi:MAG: hypothetical protein MNSN_00110 [Minisyncoccus archaeiphilus]|uniref:ATP-binding response regulator n=1 Tax=Minisyncoccus archaeiphilus TaxID=3238481 RepID=UPI002B1617A9|nr:MAG: hypothetical protein MNSN_00110 [Candidatus Parcubacteria bacterium]